VGPRAGLDGEEYTKISFQWWKSNPGRQTKSRLLHRLCVHRVSLEERSVSWELRVSAVILRKKMCTRCDNLIPGMTAACRWSVESGKLMHPSTFGHVPTCVYTSHRQNESFVPKQQKKQHVSVL
jgi:hypothetical protein